MYDLKVEITRSKELNPQIAEVLCARQKTVYKYDNCVKNHINTRKPKDNNYPYFVM